VLNNIQVLRCLAALAVVMDHSVDLLHELFGFPAFGFMDTIGRAGVDVFFVISGFIMFHTTHDAPPTPLAFWRNRAIRIVPLYWAVTFVVVGLWYLGLKPFGVSWINPQDIAASLGFFPDIRADGSPYPVLAVGWTLIYEMYFYALFGLCLLLRSQALSLAAMTAFFLAGWLALTQMTTPPHWLSVYLQPITLEFAAGGALALLWRRLPASLPRISGRVYGYGLVMLGVLALVPAAAMFGGQIKEDFGLRVIVMGPPAVLIVLGALLLERAGAASQSRTLLLLGAASYAIYLVHVLVLQFGAGMLAGFGPAVALSISAAASIAIGIAAHLWFEKPVTAFLRARSPKRRMPASAAITAPAE
jgi:exopolysaccharide production protein ExoZ